MDALRRSIESADCGKAKAAKAPANKKTGVPARPKRKTAKG